MSTLHAGYIPQHKVTSASSSGSLGFIMNFHCVWSVAGWLIVYQDGNYLYLGQYSQTICRSQYVMTPPFGREHYSVHSWKAGSDCGKLSYYQIHFMWAFHNSCPFQKSTERQFFAIALIKFDFRCRIRWTAYFLRGLISIYGFDKTIDNTSNGKKEMRAVFESCVTNESWKRL